MKKQYLIFAIIILLIIAVSIILIYAISNKKTIQTSSNNKIQNTILINKNNNINNNVNVKSNVEIVSHKIDKYGFIEVIIKNNTGKELQFVKIKAMCYDKNGNNLGNRSSGISNVNTKDNYKTEIYTHSDTAKYTLEIEYE